MIKTYFIERRFDGKAVVGIDRVSFPLLPFLIKLAVIIMFGRFCTYKSDFNLAHVCAKSKDPLLVFCVSTTLEEAGSFRLTKTFTCGLYGMRKRLLNWA